MFIADLDPSVPLDTESRSSGATRLRDIKKAIKNTFPNLRSPVYATAKEINEAVSTGGWAKGMITPFTGSTLPPGWALCNGAVVNGFRTPDLRGRFIKGGDVDSEEEGVDKPRTISLLPYISIGPTALDIKHLPRHRHRVGTYGLYSGSFGARNYGYKEPGTGGASDTKGKSGKTGGINSGRETAPHSHGVREIREMSTDPDHYLLAFIIFVGV